MKGLPTLEDAANLAARITGQSGQADTIQMNRATLHVFATSMFTQGVQSAAIRAHMTTQCIGPTLDEVERLARRITGGDSWRDNKMEPATLLTFASEMFTRGRHSVHFDMLDRMATHNGRMIIRVHRRILELQQEKVDRDLNVFDAAPRDGGIRELEALRAMLANMPEGGL